MRNRAPKRRKTNYVSDHVEEIDPCNASSAMDCTGLMPTPPRSDAEVESYKVRRFTILPRRRRRAAIIDRIFKSPRSLRGFFLWSA